MFVIWFWLSVWKWTSIFIKRGRCDVHVWHVHLCSKKQWCGTCTSIIVHSWNLYFSLLCELKFPWMHISWWELLSTAFSESRYGIFVLLCLNRFVLCVGLGCLKQERCTVVKHGIAVSFDFHECIIVFSNTWGCDNLCYVTPVLCRFARLLDPFVPASI